MHFSQIALLLFLWKQFLLLYSEVDFCTHILRIAIHFYLLLNFERL